MSEKDIYSVHPSVAYIKSVVDNMSRNTGKSLDEWVALARKEGPTDAKERRLWLKSEQGLKMTYVGLISNRVDDRGWDESDPESYLKAASKYVEELYSGAKSGLRAIHDRLIEAGFSLGQDVKVCPCRTIVPLYRKHVFAQIKPSTRTRLDFGLALKGCNQEIPPRLIDTGGLAKGDRITHRIPLSSPDEIDGEVTAWMKIAYDLDA